MEWWVWLIVAVVVMVLLVGALLAVQARRRRGGVIVDPTRAAGSARAGRTVMSRLMRTSELHKRPVVTMGGEDVAQIKDVVFAAGGGAVGGFTLAGRGLFSGPSDRGLLWGAVAALGSDAVMIDDESELGSSESVLDASAGSGGSGGDVMGSQALTDSGVDLGKVVDVIIEVQGPRGSQCDVIGYEIEASEALGTKGTRVLIPLPDTLAASGDHLMLPAAAKDFVSQDLAGFGAAVEAFREHLSQGR